MQVNLNPFTTDVELTLEHVPPALAVVATARLDGNRATRRIATRAGASRRIE